MVVKVLFLELDQEREWAVASIGPAFIGAYLRLHGHDAALLRIAPDEAPGDVLARIREHAPGLIGVSLTGRQWLRARELMNALRGTLDIPVVAGGLHATFAPQVVLAESGFDGLCLGEGEQALCELADCVERTGRLPGGAMRNIWLRGAPRPALRPPFEPIDELPFMARDLLDERHGVVHMTTQRGCPFPCTYCAARQLGDLYEGAYASYGRRRSHESVLAELESIRAHGDLNYVIFLDDTFTIHHAWVREFCRQYAQRFAVPFSLHARVETVNRAMLEELAAAGCRHVTYGVESGSERVRREIMRRAVDDARIESAFGWTRDAGILVTANYIVGTPGETPVDVEQTFALHERLAPDDFGYFVFYPYPGTALFALCRERGYLPPDYFERPANHRETILRLPDLSAADIGRYYDRFTALRTREHQARLAPEHQAHREAVERDVRRSAAMG
jgi:radical SAM superfamily enzyme YgiQ (UPF0313 family)